MIKAILPAAKAMMLAVVAASLSGISVARSMIAFGTEGCHPVHVVMKAIVLSAFSVMGILQIYEIFVSARGYKIFLARLCVIMLLGLGMLAIKIYWRIWI